MTGVDEVTGILQSKNGPVSFGALRSFVAVGRQDLTDLNVVVLEEAICGFGLRPIRACLVDGGEILPALFLRSFREKIF